jgi:putative oxidoreductase
MSVSRSEVFIVVVDPPSCRTRTRAVRAKRFPRGFHTNTLAGFKECALPPGGTILNATPSRPATVGGQRVGAAPLARWAALPLRLIVGYGFMAHGYAKLARGPEAFIGILAAIGIPAPKLMAWATIVVELLGGLSVLLGAFVTWAGVPMAAILLVAMFTVHLPNGFSSIKLQAITPAGAQFGQPGYETDLLYLACLAALALGGAGPFAVDGARARPLAARAARPH